MVKFIRFFMELPAKYIRNFASPQKRTKILSRTGPITKLPNYEAITLGPGVNGLWIDPVPELIHWKIGDVDESNLSHSRSHSWLLDT